MTYSKLFMCMGIMFPLAFSAGPANVMMAAFGARFRFAKTIPFIMGVSFVVLLQSFAVGFGSSEFIHHYPGLFRYLQIAGALYLLYLAYRFIRSSHSDTSEAIKAPPKFRDGMILQLFNMKVLAYILVLFSQFIDVSLPKAEQVILLSVGHFVLVLSATSTWTLGGEWLTKTFASKTSSRLQGYIFGSMLVAVALWMIF